jgi:hypothetical protein
LSCPPSALGSKERRGIQIPAIQSTPTLAAGHLHQPRDSLGGEKMTYSYNNFGHTPLALQDGLLLIRWAVLALLSPGPPSLSEPFSIKEIFMLGVEKISNTPYYNTKKREKCATANVKGW